jgi:acyl-coenzyme A synthetase/AMP-(fatty) acid ligase
VSALEIEAVYLAHPAISEIAIVGLPDEQWGQSVTAAVVAREGLAVEELPDLPTLRTWGRDKLAPYKLIRDLRWLAGLPRNAMGKVVKPDLTALLLKQSPDTRTETRP